MSERPTLLSRGSPGAPLAQPYQSGAPQGAFGDYRGIIAAGQGLNQAGNVGMDYATRSMDAERQRAKQMQAKMEQQQIRDLHNQTLLEDEAAQTGMKLQLDAAIRDKTLPNDPIAYVDGLARETATQSQERTAALRAHPLYAQAVSEPERKLAALKFRNKLYDQAISHVASQAMETRVDVWEKRRNAAFAGTDTPEEIVGKHTELLQGLEGDNIPLPVKERLRDGITSELFGRVHRFIVENQHPLNESWLNSLPVPEARRLDLIEASRKIAPNLTSGTITAITSEVIQAIGEGRAITGEQSGKFQRAVGAIPTAFGEAAGVEQRKIEASLASAQAFGNIGTFVNDTSTYQNAVDLRTALTTNDSAREFLRRNFPKTDWAQIPDEVFAKYRTHALKRADGVAEAFFSGKATRVLDQTPRVKESADSLVTSMRGGNLAAAQVDYIKYKDQLTREYDLREVPADKRTFLPEALMTDLDNAFLQEQAASAIPQFSNIRALAGREGTASIVRRFSNSRDGGTLRDKPHLAGLAAVMHFAHFGNQDGSATSTIDASAKEMFDSVSGLSEKQRQWSTIAPDHASLSSKVYDSIYYSSDPDADKVVSGKAISSARSYTQSLQAMGHALSWTFQDPSLQSSFRSLTTAWITARGLRGAREAGDPVSDMVVAGNDVLKNFSQAMTVADMNALENPDRIYGIVPTAKGQEEKWFQTPVPGGHGQAAEFGEDISNGIKAVWTDLYSNIDREGMGNLVDGATILRDAFSRHWGPSWLSAIPLNDSIYPMSSVLKLSLGNTNISPDYTGIRSDETALFHPTSWGAAGDPYTVAALTILQNGALHPDPVTGRMKVMVRGAPQQGTGADKVSVPSYREVIDKTTKTPVGFSTEALIDHMYQFRVYRITRPRINAQEMFPSRPLPKSLSDVFNTK